MSQHPIVPQPAESEEQAFLDAMARSKVALARAKLAADELAEVADSGVVVASPAIEDANDFEAQQDAYGAGSEDAYDRATALERLDDGRRFGGEGYQGDWE